VDPVTVAALATPFLIKAVESLRDKIWESASDTVADEAVGFGRGLLDRLLRRTACGTQRDETNPRAEAVVEAVNDLATDPADNAIQGALTVAVRKLLVSDPDLMREIAQVLEKQAPTQRAGDRSINIGGSQSGGVNVTGDSNKVSYGGPASS
jgi:hypothetical protein